MEWIDRVIQVQEIGLSAVINELIASARLGKLPSFTKKQIEKLEKQHALELKKRVHPETQKQNETNYDDGSHTREF